MRGAIRCRRPRWTCKSLRRLAGERAALGHRVSHAVAGELLKQQKFSLQGNRKTREGDGHEDRDAQFASINAKVTTALAEGQPVISVDTKKHALVKTGEGTGRRFQERRLRMAPQGEAGRSAGARLPDQGTGPGRSSTRVYDLASNAGWVSVAVNHDTAAFAVQTIRRWWQEIGRVRYPGATRLVITADGGGSNGSRVRLWKRALQHLADEIRMAIEVHHLPPSTAR